MFSNILHPPKSSLTHPFKIFHSFSCLGLTLGLCISQKNIESSDITVLSLISVVLTVTNKLRSGFVFFNRNMGSTKLLKWWPLAYFLLIMCLTVGRSCYTMAVSGILKDFIPVLA